MVKIEIARLNDDYHMQAVNEDGARLDMDATTDIGGQNKGLRPMQMLMAALGGCSAIDVISILRKQKQPLDDIKLTVTGEREPNVEPSLYTDANIHFKLYGNLDEDKVKRAISLSLEKYCSVAKTLEKTAVITSSYEIIRPA